MTRGRKVGLGTRSTGARADFGPLSQVVNSTCAAGRGRITPATSGEASGNTAPESFIQNNTTSWGRLAPRTPIGSWRRKCDPPYFGSVKTKSGFKNCQSGSSYTRSLVGTSTTTGFISDGPNDGILVEKVISGGSSGLAVVVRTFTSLFTSRISAFVC